MFEPIDDDSARSHKNDCEMYVCPVAKGVQLKQADVENLDYIAPLMYKLEIPVDIFIPNTVPVVHRRAFVQKVLARVTTEFDRSVWTAHRKARADNADFFCSLVDVFGTVPFQVTGDAKVTWKLFGFNVHLRELSFLCGIDNLMYMNVSKRLDELESEGFSDRHMEQ